MDETLSLGYVPLGRRRKKEERSGESPQDKCHGVYFALLLAGAGFLLPYNSFIIAADYYLERFHRTTIVFDMSFLYIMVAFGAVLLNNLLVEALHVHTRISFGYALSFLTLMFVAVFEVCLEAFDTSTAYRLNLLAVAVVAVGCTVQQSSFYGYTSMLPPRYTQAVMTGESAAGLMVSTNRIVTKLLLDDSKANTAIFFFISILIVFLCFVLFQLVQRTEFVRFHVQQCRENAKKDVVLSYDNPNALQPETSEEVGLVDILHAAGSKQHYGLWNEESPVEAPDSAFHSVENIHASNAPDLYVTNPVYEATYEEGESGPRKEGICHFDPTPVIQQPSSRITRIWLRIKRGVESRLQISRRVWSYMISLSMAYFVTLSLFPGIESEILSCSLKSWMPVLLMAAFNLTDFLGKVLAGIPYPWRARQLMLASVCRIVFIPLMLMCASPRASPLIPGTGPPILFSLALGLTNGVFGSLPMILAASKVPDDLKELAGVSPSLHHTWAA
ncbi:unnamed protein product [Darwinula stevensoni]|uniref:Equilibrative nucleoside transporter 4 n=1 Tax=Darwinula stevensoni TaxID=69355 RepID=A0A7R9ADH5_9CRUS|nr:unnamed protein product [Darwinula stevensoni]CAG0901320.1 unnamed protein product [Darwinula stevensoni]